MIQTKQKQSTAIYALVIVGIGFLFLFAKALLIPFAFALSLSLLLLPAVNRLAQAGIPRTTAVFIASGSACLLLVSGAALIYRQGLGVAEVLVTHEAKVKERIAAIHSPSGETLSRLTTMLEDVSAEIVAHGASQPSAQPVEIVGARSTQIREIETLAGTTLEPLGSIGVVIIFALYILMNWQELRHRLLLLAGMSNIGLMTRALDDATERISDYLVMQLEVNAGYGVLFGLALYCLHVPNAPLWGVLAGALRIVPFVGTLIGMLLPLALSVAVAPSWMQPLGVVVVFVILEFSATNFLEPWLFSEQTGISSLALLASAIFWSMLWGWPGLVLSTPLTVCLVVLGHHVPQFSFLHSLIATKARLSPPAHMYERLLAMDQDEAWAIAERYLSSHSLVQLYDSVLLPVLHSSEEDRIRGALERTQQRFLHEAIHQFLVRLVNHRDIPEDDERSFSSVLVDRLNPRTKSDFAAICVAVSDRADELAAMMLSQVLEREAIRTGILRRKVLSNEVLDALAQETSTTIYLSVLPPFAVAQAKSVCERIRSRMPENPIVIGFWTSMDDASEVGSNFSDLGGVTAVSSLQQARRE